MASPGPFIDPAHELLTLLAAEFAEGGLDCDVLSPEDGVPAQLVVPLPDSEPERLVHVCFLPGHDQPPVLQYLVAFDDDVARDAHPDLARFLQLLNATLPITGFESSEAADAIVFRHVQAISVHPLDPGVVAWPLSMIHHAVTQFGPMVSEAGAGRSFDECAAALARLQADPLDDD